MKTKTIMFCIAILFTPYVSTAAIVNYDGGTGYATGIQGLNVDGITYNVDFVAGSYDSIFGAGLPTFFNDAIRSNNAADAIMDALNAEPSVPEIAIGSSEVLWVAYLSADASTFQARQVGHDTDAAPWRRYADFFGSRAVDFSGAPNSWLYAEFTAVPIPPSIGLFAAGLFVLGLARRKRRST